MVAARRHRLGSDRLGAGRPYAPATASRTMPSRSKALLNSNNVSPWAADIIHRTGTLDNPWLGHAGRQPVPVRLAGDAEVPRRARCSCRSTPNLDTPLRAVVERDRRAAARGLVARVGELHRHQERAAVEHDGDQRRDLPDAAVASVAVHRPGHLRARGRDVHAVQQHGEHQPAA